MSPADSLLLPLVMFTAAAALTPGPNNLMLTASGANFGFRRTLPHVVGILVGFSVLLLAVALGLGALFSRYATLQLALKVIGSAYLLYLAWRIATANRTAQRRSRGRPLNVIEAAAFQFVNPKAWTFAIAAISAFTLSGDDYTRSAALVLIVFAVVTLLSTTAWAAFGTAVGTLLRTDKAYRTFNITMGLLTAASILFVLGAHTGAG
ncbi:MAG: LysE family translocator [Gammaproteobacteria bacterium]